MSKNISATRQAIQSMISEAATVMEELSEDLNEQRIGVKKPAKRYSITEVAKLLSKTPQGIRKAEGSGALPKPDFLSSGRRAGYTLAQIRLMRQYYGIDVGRHETDTPVRMSFQNFKGGVGKTTLTCHFAQYMAERGYRVLLIDADSQASSTLMFGYQPDIEILESETLYPFLCGDEEDLRYAIRETHWDQLHLIPACLDLYGAEYYLAKHAGGDEIDWIGRLGTGISTVEQDYDLVLIDAPPALGMISLNVLLSLNALIIPAPAALIDFNSTTVFLRMVDEIMESVEESFNEPLEFDIFKVVVSKFDTTKPSQEFIAQLSRQQFSDHMLQKFFVQSAEIDNAASDWKTVYELDRPYGSAKTYKRCVESMNSVFGEIEQCMQSTWPSHEGILRGTAALEARPNIRTVQEPEDESLAQEIA